MKKTSTKLIIMPAKQTPKTPRTRKGSKTIELTGGQVDLSKLDDLDAIMEADKSSAREEESYEFSQDQASLTSDHQSKRQISPNSADQGATIKKIKADADQTPKKPIRAKPSAPAPTIPAPVIPEPSTSSHSEHKEDGVIGMAGFRQLNICDMDHHLSEINAELMHNNINFRMHFDQTFYLKPIINRMETEFDQMSLGIPGGRSRAPGPPAPQEPEVESIANVTITIPGNNKRKPVIITHDVDRFDPTFADITDDRALIKKILKIRKIDKMYAYTHDIANAQIRKS